MSWTILATARAFWVSGQDAQRQLEETGCKVIHSPRPGPFPTEELIPMLEGCDAVVAASEPYNAEVFAACPQLKVVSRCGVGTDSVDMKAAAEAGVIATNTPGAMTQAVADFTLALMLAAARRLPEADALMRAGGWQELRGSGVSGKTLGLIGTGRIGSAVAERAIGFRMRILAYDPVVSSVGIPGVEFVDLETLLQESDFVSLHCPATPETTGMMNKERLEKMKPSAFLINTGRGALINETDLLQALHLETIAGAALDVYQQEPLPADHPLRSAPRTVLTPHNAFNALESTQEMSRQSALNILDLMQGRIPANVCNPNVWNSPHLRISKPGADHA